MLRWFLPFLFLSLLSGCSGIILSSTLVGAYFVSSSSSVSDIRNNLLLENKISKELSQKKAEQGNLQLKIDVFVFKNVIYLIGIAQDAKSKNSTLDYVVSEYGSNKKVIDEIKISPLEKRSTTSDYFIKNRIKAKLMSENGVKYPNYRISVFNGEVIVIGLAEDKHESTTIVEKISSIRGVKKIVSYIELKNIIN